VNQNRLTSDPFCVTLFVGGLVFRKYYRTDNRRAFFDKRFKEQDGKCAICKRQDRLVIDHDHESGLMRGLLCYTHNTALGMFYDSPELLRSAAEYLETHSPMPYHEIKTPTTAYHKHLLSQNLLKILLEDEAFPSDRARARILAEKTNCNTATAQSRIRRARKKLEKRLDT
jgi:hypothetical protein